MTNFKPIFFSKGNDLTCKISCQTAEDWEMSQKDSKYLQGKTTQVDVNKVVLQKHNKKPQRKAPKSYQCLGSHDPRSCPYIKYQCRGCSKFGCLQRARDPSRSKEKKSQQGKSKGYGKGFDRGRGFFVEWTRTNLEELTWWTLIDESEIYSDYVETVNATHC